MNLNDLLPGTTFKAKADIPRPGNSAFAVKFTFKHRTASELREWISAAPSRPDDELIYDVAEGWDLSDEYNAENVKRLCDSCPGAAASIGQAYVRELSGRGT